MKPASAIRGIMALMLLGGGWRVWAASDTGPGFREDFDTLEAWSPLTFPKIDRHTRYTIESRDGASVLRAEAEASASGLVYAHAFDPHVTPILHWRWRIENVYRNGDATRKDGDDYPLRVYVLFAYDPERASLGMRTKYALARRLYGEYPPHASLNYIWANRDHGRRLLTSPYTDRSRMVVLRAGAGDAGQWREETVDVRADYRAAFGGEPPRQATLAIMSDADNTGESAIAFIDFIEARAAPRDPAPSSTPERMQP